MKRLLKRQVYRYLLLNILTLALTLIVSFSSTLVSYSQTPQPTLNDVKKEIKELAARDVEDDIARRTEYPIKLYGGGITPGISDRQIGDIYDAEYTKQLKDKKSNWREWFKPQNGWIPFIIFLLGMIFKDILGKYFNDLREQFEQWISNRFAGRQFFQKKALKRYNKALLVDIRKQIDAYQAIKDKDAVEKAFGAVAADTRARGQAIFDFLEEMLTTSYDINSCAMAANAFFYYENYTKYKLWFPSSNNTLIFVEYMEHSFPN